MSNAEMNYRSPLHEIIAIALGRGQDHPIKPTGRPSLRPWTTLFCCACG